MGSYLQILLFVIIGIILFWFGFSLFFGQISFFILSGLGRKSHHGRTDGEPGEPQVCPVCSSRLNKGDLVKSLAFPSLTGGRDRLMHIRGCYYCLYDDLPRRCPVCGIILNDEDYLIARMFERPNRRSHVHVMGCNVCKRTGSSIK
jgi:hypothetical protein